MPEIWKHILARLEGEIPEQQVNTWLRPLQAVDDGGTLKLLAPNRFAVEWVQNHAGSRIRALLDEQRGAAAPFSIEIGSLPTRAADNGLNGHAEPARNGGAAAVHQGHGARRSAVPAQPNGVQIGTRL